MPGLIPFADPLRCIEDAYSGAVYDVLRALGYADQALPHAILPLKSGMKVCGPVFMVGGHPDTEIGAHVRVLRWTALLSKAPAGHVVATSNTPADRCQRRSLAAT